jgi:hypothetical protein
MQARLSYWYSSTNRSIIKLQFKPLIQRRVLVCRHRFHCTRANGRLSINFLARSRTPLALALRSRPIHQWYVWFWPLTHTHTLSLCSPVLTCMAAQEYARALYALILLDGISTSEALDQLLGARKVGFHTMSHKRCL